MFNIAAKMKRVSLIKLMILKIYFLLTLGGGPAFAYRPASLLTSDGAFVSLICAFVYAH